MKIIAELGINHGGNYELAMEMIKRSADAGADMVKFQIYEEKRFPDLPFLAYRTYEKLFNLCDDLVIPWFATCFDHESLMFACSSGQSIWKIPSGLVNDRKYIDDICECALVSSGKVFLSSGISSFKDIEKHYHMIKHSISEFDIEIFYCVSEYPTRPQNMNLECISELTNIYGSRVSLSDHSIGSTSIISAIIATTLNCNYLEKHVTISRNMSGYDHKASITFDELKHLVRVINRTDDVMGDYTERLVSLPYWHESARVKIESAMGIKS